MSLPETLIDYERLATTPASAAPFPHLLVADFLRREAQEAAVSAFPAVGGTGSYPPSELDCPPLFQRLLAELEGERLRTIIGEKLGIDLGGRPTMVTVRGHIAAKNGSIHTDTESKLVTLLLYFNRDWESQGGRLRLLRSASDLEDFVAEVPPVLGQMVAFKVGRNSYHGHHPAEGVRRAIQLNWVTDEGVVARELRRHRFSARVKGALRLIGG